MRRPRLAALAVFALFGGLIGWREWPRPSATVATPATVPSISASRVVLYVDLGEVDEAEGCGAIIRAVRQANSRGVATEEIDARRADPPARYRLLVAPVVLILDATGHEVHRFEGESAKTVRVIEAELGKLAASR